MVHLDEDKVERRAKQIFAKANLPNRTWGDLLVSRTPMGIIPTALSDEEQEVYLEQARQELLAKRA